MILKHSNLKYDALLPLFLGDRRYGQDIIRDFWSQLSSIGTMMQGICGEETFLFKGGQVSQGTSVNRIDITEMFAIIKTSVEIVTDWTTVPPPKMNADVSIPLNLAAQTDTSLATATLDGSTVNYVKAEYNFIDGATRQRVKRSGSYSFEGTPSVSITVDSTAPTEYQLQLATLTGNGTDTLTITNSFTGEDIVERIEVAETRISDLSDGILDVAAQPTGAQIYAAIAPSIPTVGDRCTLTGAFGDTNFYRIVSFAERTGTTQITIFSVEFGVGGSISRESFPVNSTDGVLTGVARAAIAVGHRLQ